MSSLPEAFVLRLQESCFLIKGKLGTYYQKISKWCWESRIIAIYYCFKATPFVLRSLKVFYLISSPSIDSIDPRLLQTLNPFPKKLIKITSLKEKMEDKCYTTLSLNLVSVLIPPWTVIPSKHHPHSPHFKSLTPTSDSKHKNAKESHHWNICSPDLLTKNQPGLASTKIFIYV